MTRTDAHGALEELIAQRIVILDGAMGTMLQQRCLTSDDFGGATLEGCNENLVRTRPDVVLAVHRAYLEAGVDILETNSFGGARIVLADYGLENDARELNITAARLARQAAGEFSTASKPRFVAGAMGPTTKAISVTGSVTFGQLVDSFYEQAEALMEGGADLLLLETCQDTRNAKAALVAIEGLRRKLGQRIPIMISGTIEATGTMLAGQAADAFYASVSHADLLSIGLNCASGPEFMTDHLRTISQMSLGLVDRVEQLKREAVEFMRVRAVWQYFEAEGDGNEIHLFAPNGVSPIHRFNFARQRDQGLCLSDYILPAADGRRDHLALFVVTAGAGVRERSEQWKQAGEFFKAHAIQALALETAEAGAEWLHHRIRKDWGFPDAAGASMHDRFTSKYRGKRYSFGYPACPNLDDQQGIWKLLEPADIGVSLTESMMMEPEASVSSLVFHHPDCVFFAAGDSR